jgi:hypothetical protein
MHAGRLITAAHGKIKTSCSSKASGDSQETYFAFGLHSNQLQQLGSLFHFLVFRSSLIGSEHF